MKPNIYFISGIDTDAGKSYCTAWYARELMQRGLRVITQKFIQTGNTGHSEDIDLHRRLTGTGYQRRNRTFTWKQVTLIRQYLGEPSATP